MIARLQEKIKREAQGKCEDVRRFWSLGVVSG